MLKYNSYLTENNSNTFNVECEINKDYLLEISGQNNILAAIENELNWTHNITVNNINKIKNNLYEIKITVDKKIIDDTDANDLTEAIFYEFEWLNESGIFIKKVS